MCQVNTTGTSSCTGWWSDGQELQTLRAERLLDALRGTGGDKLGRAQVKEVRIRQAPHRIHSTV